MARPFAGRLHSVPLARVARLKRRLARTKETIIELGAPPPTGNFVRAAPTAAVTTLSYQPTAATRRGWDTSDAAIKAIIERGSVL